jgi:hypothetical protein
MAENSMARFRCWSTESVARTVFSDIGALAGDADAVFLAAHTPVELEHRKGAELGSSSSGEAQVLEALTSWIGSDRGENTLVAVTGGSGSGKSHVVRWVHSHLPPDDTRFQVLYVPRAVQTLRELLRRIIEGLPGVEGNDLMSRVDAAISNVKPGEFQDRLVNEMKIALDWILGDRAPDDGETPDEAAVREDRNSMLGSQDLQSGGRRDGLADLLDIPQVKGALLRPDGRLRKLVLSYFDERSRRDDNDEIFTPDDLPLRERGVRSALAARRELAELWTVIARHPEDALALLEEALRIALPKTVGLRSANGDTLSSLFHESRQALRAQNQELVLIFEDLAQFGLVDGELFDQFATQPGDDLAPLRAVFAVTDGAYRRLPSTVFTRVDHEFHVGGSALADPAQFIGRYLNLVRVDREKTQNLWKPGADLQTGVPWMVNACDTREHGEACRFRDKCHASFGTVAVDGLGNVGLYPYNREALQRTVRHLGDDPTPRDVLDECVSTNLMEADHHIAAGDYPHERTRQLFDFRVHMAKDALQASNPSSDPERNYRALVIWGDESPLPAGVLEAFSLDGAAATPVAPLRPKQPKQQELEQVDLPNPLLPLFQWQNGDDLPEPDINYFRATLRGFTVDRLQLDQSLVHIHSGRGKEILDGLFNVTSFDIEGSRGRRAGAQSLRFELTRSAEDVHVMAAARWFRDHGHFDRARATWQWPEGYDSVQLMVELENRLDRWANEVRSRFLELTGGIRLARHAVGLRAVALAASGRSPATLNTTASVLSPPAENVPRASETWAHVNEVASRVVASLKIDEYVGDFAAVRQGGTGGPQLIDPLELDDAIEEFLASPEKSLNDVAASKADPVLAQAARQLLDALTSAASAEAESASRAYEMVTTLLEGQSPAAVGAAADDVGLLARDAGFFRPADKWPVFRRDVDMLSASTVVDPSVGDGGDLGAVLRGQRATRDINLLAQALRFAKQVMDETKEECERAGGIGGDVSTLRTEVKSQVEGLAKLANSLGSEGNHGA